MACSVCNETESKYKCSTCYIPYCSLACWKTHQNGKTCQPVEKMKEKWSVAKNLDTRYYTEDTVSEDKLNKLCESDAIRKCLKNRYLRETLIAVNDASNPEKAVYQAMKDPDFVNFVDECLKLVEDVGD